MFNLHKAIAPTLITTLLVMASACKRSEHALRLNPNVLDSYVGQYEPDSNTLVTVSREDAHLTFQVNHQGSLAVAKLWRYLEHAAWPAWFVKMR